MLPSMFTLRKFESGKYRLAVHHRSQSLTNRQRTQRTPRAEKFPGFGVLRELQETRKRSCALPAGVLIVVFAPLYVVCEKSKVSWTALAITLAVGTGSLVFGILIERTRE
jgi:hypothetical protein